MYSLQKKIDNLVDPWFDTIKKYNSIHDVIEHNGETWVIWSDSSGYAVSHKGSQSSGISKLYTQLFQCIQYIYKCPNNKGDMTMDNEKLDFIKRMVESNGNVITLLMSALHNKADGRSLIDISNELAGMGIGHIPKYLPTDQSAPVRLYKRGTPVGNFIESVLTPGDRNDRKLIEAVGSTMDYSVIIEKIRDLVA